MCILTERDAVCKIDSGFCLPHIYGATIYSTIPWRLWLGGNIFIWSQSRFQYVTPNYPYLHSFCCRQTSLGGAWEIFVYFRKPGFSPQAGSAIFLFSFWPDCCQACHSAFLIVKGALVQRRRGSRGWSGLDGWGVSVLFDQMIPQHLQMRLLQLDEVWVLMGKVRH